jgi:hypothetical protein
MNGHRFPPPWTVEEMSACFVLRDANGEVLAYVNCEEAAAKLLSKDEARRIASPTSPSRHPALTISLGYRVLTPVT